MSNFYDDSRFGVVERKWFGLTKKHGGDVASGYTFGTTDATVISQLARHYFKGPIAIQKVGSYVLATIGGGSAAFDQVPARITKNGTNVSSLEWNIPDTGAPYSIASVSPSSEVLVPAGSYIGIETATPESTNGTAYNTATVTGSVAFFVEYRRVWHQAGNWDT